MKTLVSVVLVILSIQISNAWSPVWYEGSLVLKTNEVLCGTISVHPAYDIVMFKSGDQLKVYTADKVESFFFYDLEANINRKFISLTLKINAFTFNHLYEQVLFGEVRILRRIASEWSDVKNDRDGYDYFVRLGDETIEFNKFRTRVYPYLITNSESLVPYIKQNKLNPNNPSDVIKIVDHYNKGLKSRAVIARN